MLRAKSSNTGRVTAKSPKPSMSMYRPSLARLDPIAIRSPISPRRRSVRNQKVPTIPKNTFTRRKLIVANVCLFARFAKARRRSR